MRKRVIRLLTAICLAGLPVLDAMAQSRDEIARWVEDVALGPEFGGSGRVVARWVTTPSLSVFGATAGQQEAVERALEEINAALADTPIRHIAMRRPEDATADIQVHFAVLRALPRLAREHGFRYVPGNWGMFWTFWQQHRIHRAYVLLASDRLRGPYLGHFVLEEITQSLGLSSDSPVFANSIFYSEDSQTVQLSALDRKLIAFVYNHLEPGATQRELRDAFAAHWPRD